MHDGDINNYTKTWHNPSTLYRVDDIPVGISEKGWVIACSGRWYTDLVFLIQSNI